MLSENITEYAIEVDHLSKCYQIYDKPSDRLKQMLMRGHRKYYREFWALKDVSFKIERGETVAIIGRNGSGKSTLLQMICGTLNPTTGNVKTNGRVAALLELGAGFNPEFSGMDNLRMAASLYGLPNAEIDQRTASILSFADIGDHIHQPVKTYSSGMYVRLAFAVIAHVDADILIVDEALAVGDVFFQQKCMRYLRGFQEAGGNILLVTHDTSSVVSMCNKAILLSSDRERPHQIGTADSICKLYLENLYKDFSKQDSVQQIQNNGTFSTWKNIDRVKGESQAPARYFISTFKRNSSSFGEGKGEIIDAGFYDSEDCRLETITAEQRVRFEIKVAISHNVMSPAFGFMLKNRHGDFLFTEGTDRLFRAQNLELIKGQIVKAIFEFDMPNLINGKYTINVAFAEGKGDEHQQQHWIHDALLLDVSSSRLVHGYCGMHGLETEIRILHHA